MPAEVELKRTSWTMNDSFDQIFINVFTCQQNYEIYYKVFEHKNNELSEHQEVKLRYKMF